jgi:hypothetical protein
MECIKWYFTRYFKTHWFRYIIHPVHKSEDNKFFRVLWWYRYNYDSVKGVSV